MHAKFTVPIFSSLIFDKTFMMSSDHTANVNKHNKLVSLFMLWHILAEMGSTLSEMANIDASLLKSREKIRKQK